MRSIEAANLIKNRWDRSPRIGMILGTGASQVADQMHVDDSVPYSELGDFPQSTSIGHVGKWICGELATHPVIAMQGRFHVYEGYSARQVTVGIETMHQLGVELLLISNAAGGVNPYYQPGDLMVIDSHLDFIHHPRGRFRSTVANNTRGKPLYDPDFVEHALQIARQEDFPLHRGVYAAMLGPSYETRAEYRFLRTIGADAVGMSTAPEVIAAKQFGMRVMAVSIIANVANPDRLSKVSGEAVVNSAKIAAPRLCKLFTAATNLFAS